MEREVAKFIYQLDGADDLFSTKEKLAWLADMADSDIPLSLDLMDKVNDNLFKNWARINRILYKKALRKYKLFIVRRI